MSVTGMKPCPFCGHGDVILSGDNWDRINDEDGYAECFVYCPLCGTHGPHAFRYRRSMAQAMAEAMEAWNMRADE